MEKRRQYIRSSAYIKKLSCHVRRSFIHNGEHIRIAGKAVMVDRYIHVFQSTRSCPFPVVDGHLKAPLAFPHKPYNSIGPPSAVPYPPAMEIVPFRKTISICTVWVVHNAHDNLLCLAWNSLIRIENEYPLMLAFFKCAILLGTIAFPIL